MRSYSVIIISVIITNMSLYRCSGSSTPSDPTDIGVVPHHVLQQPRVRVNDFDSDSTARPAGIRPNGRLLINPRSRINRATDSDGEAIAIDRSDYVSDGDVRRTINTYHHVNDGTSSAGDGWIIGGSRRRGPAGAQKHYQDKTSGDDERPEKSQLWSASTTGGSEAASSLSEVQVVVHPSSPYRDDEQQQQSTDASSSKWYSKRLSYATKTSPAGTVTPPSYLQQQPMTAGSNAVLLAEVLGQKSGFNTTAGKGAAVYYGTTTGSKGFQNDLMDMLGKST